MDLIQKAQHAGARAACKGRILVARTSLQGHFGLTCNCHYLIKGNIKVNLRPDSIDPVNSSEGRALHLRAEIGRYGELARGRIARDAGRLSILRNIGIDIDQDCPAVRRGDGGCKDSVAIRARKTAHRAVGDTYIRSGEAADTEVEGKTDRKV